MKKYQFCWVTAHETKSYRDEDGVTLCNGDAPDELLSDLNRLGQEGWHAVGYSTGNGSFARVLMQREITVKRKP